MSATNQFPPPHLIPDDNENEDKSHNESSQNNESTTTERPADEQSRQQLALPGPETNTTTSNTTPAQQLHVSSSSDADGSGDVKHTISFGHLGPLVINKDGTLSRIHNWTQMGDAERERVVRVLGKRNMLRKEAILKDGSETGGS